MSERTKWQNFIWLIKRSLALDTKLISRAPHLSFVTKVAIIFKKYFLLLKHMVIPFKFGEDHVSLGGKNVYYNNGLASYAGYQAVLVEHMYWFDKLNLPTSPVIIDIGANVGYVSTILSDAYKDSTIYAFEPSSKVFSVLEKNAKSYKNIHLFKKGFGDANKSIEMFVDKKESAFSSITHKLSNDYEVEDIEIQTLDTFVAAMNIKKIDLLKLDVEGFELEVLKGAKNTLKLVKYLHMELNSKDYLLSELCQIILDAGVKFNLKYIRNFDNESDGLFLDGDVLFELSI